MIVYVFSWLSQSIAYISNMFSSVLGSIGISPLTLVSVILCCIFLMRFSAAFIGYTITTSASDSVKHARAKGSSNKEGKK